MVERSLLRDFVTDKRLIDMFRSELTNQLRNEQTEARKVQIVSEQMIAEQIQRIANANNVAMEGLEAREREVAENVIEKGAGVVEFKGGIMRDIDESFFAGVVEEIRL